MRGLVPDSASDESPTIVAPTFIVGQLIQIEDHKAVDGNIYGMAIGDSCFQSLA